MKLKKLKDIIERQKTIQAKEYYNAIRKVVKNDPQYYKDKGYAKFFMK